MNHNSEREQNGLDSLLEGFQTIGFDWKYLFVNKAVVAQSKVSSKQDLIGFTMMEKFPGIEKTEMFRNLERCMTQRFPLTMENEFEFPDSSKGWFELRIEPVPDGIFILSIDITERKKAEMLRDDHIRGLEEVVFMTSHRLRQPVTHILGVANLLDQTVQSQNDLQAIASHMKTAAESLDAYTRELTTYIQILQKRATV